MRSVFAIAWPELVMGLLFGLSYLFIVPLWEAPDEPYHYGNVAYVWKHGSYPLKHFSVGERGIHGGERSQPPLYYWLASFVTSPWARPWAVGMDSLEDAPCSEGAWKFLNIGDTTWPRLLRGVSLLLLMGTALVLALAVRTAFPGDPLLAATAVSMVWIVPQALFAGSIISNDSLAMLAGAGLFALWLHAAAAPTLGRMILVGTAGFIAAFAKFNLVPLYVMGLLLAYAAGSGGLRERLQYVGAYCIPGLWASAVALLVRHDLMTSVVAVLSMRFELQRFSIKWLPTVEVIWESYWARFGWMNVGVPDTVRYSFWTLSIILLLGAAFWVSRQKHGRRAAFLAAALVAAQCAGLFVNLLSVGHAQGRHLFPAMAAFAFLGAIGLRAYVPAMQARWTAIALGIAGNLYAVGFVIPGAYAVQSNGLLLGTACCHGAHVSPLLSAGRPERQAFISTLPGLTRVGVVPATFRLPIRGEVEMTLLDRRTAAVIAKQTVQASELRDGRFFYLDFTPVAGSAGRWYIIKIEAGENLKGSLSLFYSSQDRCADAMRISGPGDLRFATYHAKIAG